MTSVITEDEKKRLAEFVGLPSLHPFQFEVPARLKESMDEHPNSPNTTFLIRPTGDGKSYLPLVWLANNELFSKGNVKSVVLYYCPLNRAMDGVIAKTKKIKTFRALTVTNDWSKVVNALTVNVLEHNTIIFYNPIDVSTDNKLVELVQRAQFLRIRLFVHDEIALSAQWKDPSFRPLLSKMYIMVDAWKSRHFGRMEPPILIETAAATASTRTEIKEIMHIEFTRTEEKSPDRTELQLLVIKTVPKKINRVVVKLAAEFNQLHEMNEKCLILVRGSVGRVQNIAKSLHHTLNPNPNEENEPVSYAFSGEGCPEGNYMIRNFNSDRICSTTVNSARYLVAPDMYVGVGFDDPGITCVILIGPPSNAEEYTQFAGRCRGKGVVYMVCTWQQRCRNLFHMYEALGNKESDADVMATNGRRVVQANRLAELVMYPKECIRKALNACFCNTVCNDCTTLRVAECSGCSQKSTRALVYELKDYVPNWYIENQKKMKTVEWNQVINGSAEPLVNNVLMACLVSFLEDQGVLPINNLKKDVAKQIISLCAAIRFNESQMFLCLQNRLGTSEKKQMHTLVRELANDMKVTELQSRDVLRRLILHQTITDEPPANMANQIVATSIDALNKWRVSRGPKFYDPKPPLQPKERQKARASNRGEIPSRKKRAANEDNNASSKSKKKSKRTKNTTQVVNKVKTKINKKKKN